MAGAPQVWQHAYRGGKIAFTEVTMTERPHLIVELIDGDGSRTVETDLPAGPLPVRLRVHGSGGTETYVLADRDTTPPTYSIATDD